jgi:hypothetical protein
MLNKLIEFSTNNHLFLIENDGNLSSYPTEQFVKYLKSLKLLVISKWVRNEEELFTNLPKTISRSYIRFGELYINSINRLIESNKNEIFWLLLNAIFINEEMLERIYKTYELEIFSFSQSL